MKKSNAIATMRPDLASEWDYIANFPLTPDMVSIMSHKKVGWVCARGHTWEADPQHRARSKKPECPYCSGKIVVQGENDLATLYPYLVYQWHPEKNGDLDPHTLPRACNKRVWWKCDKGHEWQSKISYRTKASTPTDCPYCTGRRVIAGINDLASQRPEIAAQWHYGANAPLLPTQVTVSSGKSVYWKCEKGHVWKTSIAHRTNSRQPTNCPYCSGRKALPGETDLATLYPQLIKEWDYDFNQNLDPTKLRPHSGKKAHWICKRGHRWTTTILRRTSRGGSNCPYCSGRFAIPGETDLQTRYPAVAAEWNWAKNGDQTPENISAASNKKVWWICGKGHQWEATIASRTCQGNNCPVCSGRKPDIGINDLATLRPDIVIDWCTERNDGKQPQNYTCNSGVMITWQCHRCGTIWSKSIRSRVQGNKCPSCYRSRFWRV